MCKCKEEIENLQIALVQISKNIEEDMRFAGYKLAELDHRIEHLESNIEKLKDVDFFTNPKNWRKD